MGFRTILLVATLLEGAAVIPTSSPFLPQPFV